MEYRPQTDSKVVPRDGGQKKKKAATYFFTKNGGYCCTMITASIANDMRWKSTELCFVLPFPNLIQFNATQSVFFVFATPSAVVFRVWSWHIRAFLPWTPPLVALLQQAKTRSTKSYSTYQEQVWSTKRRILCLMGTTQGLWFFQRWVHSNFIRWVHTTRKLRSLFLSRFASSALSFVYWQL